MIQVPRLVTQVAERVREAGGRALLVGGGVRDVLLGIPPKDFDLEVYGIEEPALHALLERIGRVNAVGRSFGVLKVTRDGLEIDVSLPRTDSKVGKGHRGIAVVGNPQLDLREAARRRDLTINAISMDPLDGTIHDPWNGRADLDRRRLAAVDRTTFLEDPLRALRVVQFAARLQFEADPELVALCREAALDELPPERICGEWQKLMLHGAAPSAGMRIARESAILARVFPEAVDSIADAALDRLAARRDRLDSDGRRFAAMLVTWLHATPKAGVEATLNRLWLHKAKGYPLRDRVVAAVGAIGERPSTDAQWRRLATRCEPMIFVAATSALDAVDADPLYERIRALNIADGPEEPLLKGRHLEALGLSPGPAMGRILKAVYERQIDGEIRDEDAAIEAGRALM